jgi:hypothetical protein
MIRHFKPKRIIEVGAGFSTMLATLAGMKNSDTQIIAVDPYVRTQRKIQLPSSVEFVEQKVQDLDESFFKKLSTNDILFIDSSHVSKAGSDVNHLFLKIVIIHVHDIFLPKEFPYNWIKEHHLFWNEQYLLHAFLSFNKNFQVLLGNCFLGIKYPNHLTEFFKSDKPPGGGSFWMKKL